MYKKERVLFHGLNRLIVEPKLAFPQSETNTSFNLLCVVHQKMTNNGCGNHIANALCVPGQTLKRHTNTSALSIHDGAPRIATVDRGCRKGNRHTYTRVP